MLANDGRKIGNTAKQRLLDYVRAWAAEHVSAYRSFTHLLAEAFKKSSIAESPKLILAWIAGIAAAITTGGFGALLFGWVGLRRSGALDEGDFVAASSSGLSILAIVVGVRTGRRVAHVLVKPPTDQYYLAAALGEKALLRGITAGALVFTLLTIPLDWLSLVGTTWLAAIVYVAWVCVALALAIVWGRIVAFHTKRIASKHRKAI